MKNHHILTLSGVERWIWRSLIEWLERNYGQYEQKLYSVRFTLNPTFCQNLMIFHQTIDLNMKFRYSLIINDHQIYEKNIKIGQKFINSNKLEWKYGQNGQPKTYQFNIKDQDKKLTDAVVFTTLYFICNVPMSPIR